MQCRRCAGTAHAALVLVRRAERTGSSGAPQTAVASVIVMVRRASAAQSTANDTSPVEAEGLAGSAGHRPQSGPRGTHGGAPVQAGLSARGAGAHMLLAGARLARSAVSMRDQCGSSSPGEASQSFACAPASTCARSKTLAMRQPVSGPRCGRGAWPAVQPGPPRMRLADEAQQLAPLRGAVGNVIPQGPVGALAARGQDARRDVACRRRRTRLRVAPRARTPSPACGGVRTASRRASRPQAFRALSTPCGTRSPTDPRRSGSSWRAYAARRRGPQPHGWPRAPAAARAAAGVARRQRPARGGRGRRRARSRSAWPRCAGTSCSGPPLRWRTW